MPLIRIASLLTACLAVFGLVAACANPDADAWESLISKSEQVEKELEELEWEQTRFFGHNPEWQLPRCARPTWESMFNELSPVELGDLSRDLDRWQEYAEALAEASAGRDVRFTAGSHLVEIEVDVGIKRQAFEEGLETFEFLRCPVYYPWK